MKCWLCPRPLTRADAPDRAEWRERGGVIHIHGCGNEPLKMATGRLVKAAHRKCYFAWKRRAASDCDARTDLEEQGGHEGNRSSGGAVPDR